MVDVDDACDARRRRRRRRSTRASTVEADGARRKVSRGRRSRRSTVARAVAVCAMATAIEGARARGNRGGKAIVDGSVALGGARARGAGIRTLVG